MSGCGCRYSAADYRDRLYREIARRKSEVRDARAPGKDDKAPAVAAAGAGAGGAAAPKPAGAAPAAAGAGAPA